MCTVVEKLAVSSLFCGVIKPALSARRLRDINPLRVDIFGGECISYHFSTHISLRWRHNERDSISNHQPHDCLLNCLFRSRSKKTSKLRVTGLCAGNSPGTGEFPAQMASYAENVSIWWRHHDDTGCWCPSSWKIKMGFSYIISTKAADALAVPIPNHAIWLMLWLWFPRLKYVAISDTKWHNKIMFSKWISGIFILACHGFSSLCKYTGMECPVCHGEHGVFDYSVMEWVSYRL